MYTRLGAKGWNYLLEVDRIIEEKGGKQRVNASVECLVESAPAMEIMSNVSNGMC